MYFWYTILKYSKKCNFKSIKWYAIRLSSAFIMEKRDKGIMYPFKYPVYVLITILEILLKKKWLSRKSCTLYKPNKCLQSKLSQRKYTNIKICCCHCCCLVAKSCLTLSWSHGLQPNRLLCPWDFPGKDIGVGCPFLLQGIIPTQRLNLCLLHW